MTQYQRITGKVFGGNATATGNDPQIAQFGSALANTFVGTTDPETIQSLPAWGQGWIGAVTPETQFPPLPEMTGAMKVLSHQICGILQQGISTWDSGTVYYENNFCSKNGIIYKSLTNLNQGNDPATDSTNWLNTTSANLDLSNLSSTGQGVINAKLNTNLSNITDTSKATITSWGFPASRYTELTLGASDSSYTAPADGWYIFGKSATSAGQYFVLSNASSGLLVAQQATQTSTYIANYIKARKGQRVAVGYTLGGATRFFGFVEAQGEV